ncbi:adenosylcobinamide amidohydrolase [Caldalkalibacillus salinus]|uniref:adenosylcobinamide amidohydrolase n=1 Tax=Caldalkalibacillus salinus TaxID=2803787 RepID=UPI001F3DC879|nr:adenosylcobinamide amidohydrolase [Caldalkalibacillus salinus]
MSDAILKIDRLTGGYDHTPILKNVTLDIMKGEFFTLLGPNGSGKTTLFKLLTGALSVTEGSVTLARKPLESYSKKEKARLISVLTQEQTHAFDYTVEEIVSLGRYPYLSGWFPSLTKKDNQVIEEVLNLTQTSQYKKKRFSLLSGGEKQRVLLAKALVQEPEIVLLDEPTNHLDIHHTFHVLQLLKEWQRQKGLTVFAILHDLNTAALYSDRVGLLKAGQLKEVGPVHKLKREKSLEETYDVKVSSFSHPQWPHPQFMLTPPRKSNGRETHFRHFYHVSQSDECVHVHFKAPVRTISNGVTGSGLQWIRHLCNFHVPMDYDCTDPVADIQQWIRARQWPVEDTVGMMTAVQLQDVVVLEQEIEGIAYLALVTAGVGNAVDITSKRAHAPQSQVGTINTFICCDTHLTDGAFVNAMMSASEAKTKAVIDQGVHDPHTHTPATGTSTDSMCIAATQEGPATPYAGSGTPLGRGIGQLVYEATTVAIQKYKRRQNRS